MTDHTIPMSSWFSLGSTVAYESDKKEGLKCSTPLSSHKNPISGSWNGSSTSISCDSFCCPWPQCQWSCLDAAQVEGHLAGDHLNYFPYSCCICRNRLPSLKQLRDHEELENHPQYEIRHNPRIQFEKIIRAEKEKFRSSPTPGVPPFPGFSSQFDGFCQPKLESGPIEVITLDGEGETRVKSENSWEQVSFGDLAHDDSTSTVGQYENPFENFIIRDYSEIVRSRGESSSRHSVTPNDELQNGVTNTAIEESGSPLLTPESPKPVETTSAANIEAKNRRHDENAHINLQEKFTSSSSTQNDEDNDSIEMFEISNDEKSIWDIMSQTEKGDKEEGQKSRKRVKVKPISEYLLEDPLNKQRRQTPKKSQKFPCVACNKSVLMTKLHVTSHILGTNHLKVTCSECVYCKAMRYENGDTGPPSLRRHYAYKTSKIWLLFRHLKKTHQNQKFVVERQDEVDECIQKWFPSLNQSASNEDEPVHRSYVDLEHEEGQFQ